MIQFKNVTKRFGLNPVLDNISFTVSPGEMVAVVGPSGAGKTTLLHLLLGAHLPTKGEVLVDDMSVPHLSPHDLQTYRRRLGTVFQDYKLLPAKTVWENLLFMGRGQSELERKVLERLEQTLEMVGLLRHKVSFPHELSGGEAQRAAIARALVHDPSLLIADEPTGNLDLENEKNIMDILKKINREGKTVILTTHNIPLAQRIGCRLIHLKSGKIV